MDLLICPKYHTDSEEGLGPVVSSLSLGAPAWMHFRLRGKKSGKRRLRELSIPLLHVSRSLKFGNRNPHVIDRETFSSWRVQKFKMRMRYARRCLAFSSYV